MPPVPDIKANGQDGPISISSGNPVSITVGLDPGSYSGQNADWWVYADTSFGFYSYLAPGGWKTGFMRTMALPLMSLSSYGILNMPLPAGSYLFYFFVDDNPTLRSTGHGAMWFR